jgi:hypothetical protein
VPASPAPANGTHAEIRARLVAEDGDWFFVYGFNTGIAENRIGTVRVSPAGPSSRSRTVTHSPTPSTRDRRGIARLFVVAPAAVIAAAVAWMGDRASRRSRVASRTVTVSPHLRWLAQRQALTLRQRSQRLTGTLLGFSHGRVALTNGRHDPLGQGRSPGAPTPRAGAAICRPSPAPYDAPAA